jgi:hypothetical protein
VNKSFVIRRLRAALFGSAQVVLNEIVTDRDLFAFCALLVVITSEILRFAQDDGGFWLMTSVWLMAPGKGKLKILG